MLTLVRPDESVQLRKGLIERKAWNELTTREAMPRLRLVRANGEREPIVEHEDEVLTMALDRLIDHAQKELSRERARARAALAHAPMKRAN